MKTFMRLFLIAAVLILLSLGLASCIGSYEGKKDVRTKMVDGQTYYVSGYWFAPTYETLVKASEEALRRVISETGTVLSLPIENVFSEDKMERMQTAYGKLIQAGFFTEAYDVMVEKYSQLDVDNWVNWRKFKTAEWRREALSKIESTIDW